MIIASRLLDAVDDVIARSEDELDNAFVLDGRLTSFERVPSQIRGEILSAILDTSLYREAFPEGFAHALGVYPSAPGRWMLSPWFESGLSVDWEQALRFLAPVIVNSDHGQDRVPTRAKFVALARHFKAGKILVSETVSLRSEEFERYPDRLSEEERKSIEPVIRAMFMGVVGPLDDSRGDGASEAWAREFWRSNWHIYPCSFPDYPIPAIDHETVSDIRATIDDRVDSLYQQFMDSALTADPDLYNPDRYEVLTGITLRTLRLSSAASRSLIYWTGEYGLPLVRVVLEALIVLRWLLKVEVAEYYRRFKDYGRGHLKLLKLHLDEYIEANDEVPVELKEYHEHLKSEVSKDISEEWQEISLHGSFAGKSLREMAGEVDMQDEYRLMLAPASSSLHGEWSELDRYALDRCENPLHRGHRVPRRNLSTPVSPYLIPTVLDLVEDLVDSYVEGIRASRSESSDI